MLQPMQPHCMGLVTGHAAVPAGDFDEAAGPVHPQRGMITREHLDGERAAHRLPDHRNQGLADATPLAGRIDIQSGDLVLAVDDEAKHHAIQFGTCSS